MSARANTQKILRTYNTTDDTELEFRFHVRHADIVKKLITSVGNGKKTIEQSINFISPGIEASRICKILFLNGTKQGSEYMSKALLDKGQMSDGALPFKLTVSHEREIPQFDVNLSKLARIKLRLSIRPDNIPGWRIDFTLVKSVNDIKSNIKKDKDGMLFELGIDNFIDDAPWEYMDGVELEIEHVSADKNVSVSDIDLVTSYIFGLVDPGYQNMFEYQSMIYKIATFIVAKKKIGEFKRNKGIRDLYNRVWELNKSTYFGTVFPNIRNYYLLDKADGIRTLIVIDGTNMTVLNDKLIRVPLEKENIGITIFDAEYIETTSEYYVFDVLVFKGENITRTQTSNRISYIPAVVEMSEGHTRQKTITSLTDNYMDEITKMWESDKPYDTDGIIFTPKDGEYQSMKSWKWKPLTHMSIDFLVKRPPEGTVGVRPYDKKENHTLFFLFSGIRKQSYDKLRLMPVAGYKKIFPRQKMYDSFPIQFSPSDEPFAYMYYHPNDSAIKSDDILNNVCEFRRIDLDDNPRWDLMRIRTDRVIDLERGNYFGNGFYIAEYTWQNYQNPLLLDDLTISSGDYMDRGYFKEEKSAMHKHVTGFNSFVKGRLLSKFTNASWIVDLAAGRGQDMFRVSDANISNALFMDNDPHALSELISRKHGFQRGVKKLNTRIFTKLVDLTADYKGTVESIAQLGVPVGSVDVIMCNFAIHYLVGTPDNVRNIIHLIRELLKPGGFFFFTAFDGKKIFDALGSNDAWERREGESLKYAIRKKYTSDALEETGQSIDVLLPFSGGTYYTEYLVNFKYLANEFNLNGFVTKRTGSFSDYMPLFKRDAPTVYKKITADDSEYVSMYGYGIFQKRSRHVNTGTGKIPLASTV